MDETLPRPMVARVLQLAADLTVWAQRHPDATLAEQEQAVLGLVRAALPDLLTITLPLCTRGLRLPQQDRRGPCPGCGKACGAQEWRERRLLTVCGPVHFERPWYRCRRCKKSWAPVDTVLGVEARSRLSTGLTGWLVQLGAATDFREAAAVLRQLTGLVVAAETVRQHTEVQGTALEATAQAARATVANTREPAEVVAPVPGQLLVETDGVMVRYQDGWHEVKLGLVGGHADGTTQDASYVAARETAEAFGPRLLTEAARRGALEVVGWTGPMGGRGLAQLPRVVVLGDGAHWIWHLAAEHFGERLEIVDFYHASQHLWEVAHTVYGVGSAAARAWAETQRTALLTQGAAPVVTALGRLTAPSPEASALLKREREYFRTNQTRMDYPTFRAQGCPIGSGAVESGAKHVVQLRMKRPGARWGVTGAHGVLMVRTYLLSGRPLVPTPRERAA